MGVFRRIRSYVSGWLERRIVDPLYDKLAARYEAQVNKSEERLEKSIEDLKINAKRDLAAVVGSASAGLTNEFQDLKKNFGYLSSHFDNFVKEVDAKINEINTNVDEAIKKINSSVQGSEKTVLEAKASYEAARGILEEMKTSFESAKKELLEAQTQYQLDYSAFRAAAKSVQETITGLEAKVNDWSLKAHELLSVDLTAERLDFAHETGEKLLKSINGAKANIKGDVLAAVRTELSTDVASAVKTLSEEMRKIADERAYNLMVYALEIPENRRGIVCWVADYNGNYELIRNQLKDGSARGWLTLFEKDVKEKNINLKYLAAIVKLIGYRQKNLKPS